ncbi:MAG: ABC transporter ATP-binding protein [Actinobacteria bacterium]|nr:ABC transporter ATP-binding protein [Actinomycetota bacterium]
MTPVLEVTDLRVRYRHDVDALRGVSLLLDRGDSLAIVGESGSGKTTLAHCIVGLVQPPDVVGGSALVAGHEIVGADPELLRSLRWSTVAIALQGAPLNPVVRVGAQLLEPLQQCGVRDAHARRRIGELADELLPRRDVLERYPHELSGGERQRVMLAMTLVLDPELVILDEPGAGLDPLSKQELVESVAQLAADRNFALLVISHDLPAATRLALRTLVLYAGETMEEGATSGVIGRPEHPYTWALVNAYPVLSTTKDLRPIRGTSPDPRAIPPGCPFNPRCTQAEEICSVEHPALAPSRGRLVTCHFGGLKTLLEATGLRKRYPGSEEAALDDVSVVLHHGESVGVVGPTGSGKTTLARILAGDLTPDGGEVRLQGESLHGWGDDTRALRRQVQLIQQDPWDALSPRLSVEALVGEPLHIGGSSDRGLVVATLEAVGLPTSGAFLEARAAQLSGGELQRIALVRALIAHPKMIVADEPTSMLDASEQARLLVQLRELQVERGLGLVLVSHDLALVRKVTDRIVVLDGGRVVESGSSAMVSTHPRSATGRALVDAAPVFDLYQR